MSKLKSVAIIQARTGSTRLPGKVLEELAGLTILEWVTRAAAAVPGIDHVVVATTDAKSDDTIATFCADKKIACFRGSEDDVLARFAGAAREAKADIVMRLTADCPLLDPHVCGQSLAMLIEKDADYATNCDPATWPDGLDNEVFTAKALYEADEKAHRRSQREHVTPYIRNSRYNNKVEALICPIPNLQSHRWTVDTPEDLEFLRAVAPHLPTDRPPHFIEVLSVLRDHPEMLKINAESTRNEGFALTIANEPVETGRTFETSNNLLKRAQKTIPLGSQTFSKSVIQYPEKHAPLFLTHGDGARVWDVDGNEFVDLVCGLLPVLLGYRDTDVDTAVRRQLVNGVSFSQSTVLEMELSERLTRLVPCAEMVRYGKNGTDATSAAVRLSRAYTKREHIMVCGYHGWQDWYIGSTSRHLGVPQGVRDLTHPVPYNDLDAVERMLGEHKGKIAAMIVEPMNAAEPTPGYLKDLKSLLHDHGTLLVFDEIITGFRYAVGGAQEYFGVTPDLASFGKAMGNGMPISAIMGRGDVMSLMEEVFFSGTFAGEALSLAASIAVVDKLEREPVVNRLWDIGGQLAEQFDHLIAKHQLAGTVALLGAAPWKILSVSDHPEARKEAIKTRLQYEMLQRGVLLLGSHNVCYAHNSEDINHVIAAYDAALGIVSEELKTGRLEERLPCPAVEPVFRVR